MATIIDSMRNPGSPTYYSKGWINTVEDHISYFQDDGNGTLYTPTGKERTQYKYRFYAFLRDIIGRTRPEHYYIYLRANNMTSPMEFNENFDRIIIPDENKIESLFQQYQSSMP